MSAEVYECDVLVVGSGAAGMATALRAADDGLDVIVVEKLSHLGGTSAISGGWLWVPGNRGQAGGDTRELAQRYVRALAGDSYREDLVTDFLDEVPGALAFFEDRTDVEFVYPDLAPDYRMEVEGAQKSGRAVTVQRADARVLGRDRLRVQPYLYELTVFGYMPEIGGDIATVIRANRSMRAFLYLTRRVLRTWTQGLFRRRSLTRSNGNALMTQMFSTASRLGVTSWTRARATQLTTDDSGRVVGARVERPEGPAQVRARRGVVLATGGFAGDAVTRSRYFAQDPSGDRHLTPTIGHDGDAVALSAPLGATIDSSPHQPASWAPLTSWRNLRGQIKVFPHLRAFGLPGLIAIDHEGRRFANESSSYHDFGMAMLERGTGTAETPAYIVGDRRAMHTYGIGYAKPWPLPSWYYRRVGYLIRERTLEGLAHRLGVPAGNLTSTVAEFNRGAQQGTDPRFARGSTWFHHFKGDMTHSPNPNLAPLGSGPFYAAPLRVGDLGTFAGLAVDRDHAVVREDGSPIDGLYAVGAASVSVFGGGYPGYGAHLGPAMVSGHRVGRLLAQPR